MALLTSTRPILDPKIATALGVRAEIQPALNIQALRLYSNITNQLVCDMVQTTKGWLTGLLTVSSAEMSPFLPLNNTLTPRLPEYLAQNGTTVHNTVNAALASALIPYIVNQIAQRLVDQQCQDLCGHYRSCRLSQPLREICPACQQ